jgi:hypothetical protein
VADAAESIGTLQFALDAVVDQQQVIANNIVNEDTPHPPEGSKRSIASTKPNWPYEHSSFTDWNDRIRVANRLATSLTRGRRKGPSDCDLQ